MGNKFTKPKNFIGSFFNCKRVPRKFKKKWKYILQGSRYDFLDLNQKLWLIQGTTNPEYNAFLTLEVCKYEKRKALYQCKVLTVKEVEEGRSNAYEYMKLPN